MSIQIEIPTSDNDYVRTFSPDNPKWSNNNVLHNYFFLKSQQNYFNQLLRVRGHVFLNDVLIALGFDQTKIGTVTGWTITGASYVDFGLFDTGKTITEQSTVDVTEIRLEFNVDGVIVHTI